MLELPERILAKLSPAAGGCLLWTGTVTANGYGRAWDGRRSDWVHRVVYRLTKGPISPGYQIDHLCRVTTCVNPDHLDAVEPAENHRRSTNAAVTKARHQRQAFCKLGHPLFGSNVYRSPSGRRVCRTCHKQYKAAYLARRDVLLELANR